MAIADDRITTEAEGEMDPSLTDAWLRADVAPVYDMMIADPGRAIAADQVMHALREHHEAGQKPVCGA